MTAISTKQIAAIHALAKNAGLDEASRRDVIAGATGKRSSRELTMAEGFRVIESLKALAPGQASSPSRRSPAKTMSGKYAPVLRALWLAGYNLGVVENRDDAALIAFVERQTKIAHPRFLLDASDAAKAIEGLKKWISREALVNWNEKYVVVALDDDGNVAAAGARRCPKRAVLTAQIFRLRGYAITPPDWPPPNATDAELDALSAEIGRQLREAAKRAKSPKSPQGIKARRSA